MYIYIHTYIASAKDERARNIFADFCFNMLMCEWLIDCISTLKYKYAIVYENKETCKDKTATRNT